jgi:hypothetical protein
MLLSTAADPLRHRLLEDGLLELSADPALSAGLAEWLPRIPSAATGAARPDAAHIRVECAGPEGVDAPTAHRTFRLFRVSAWVDGERDQARLHGGDPRAAGLVDLSTRHAVLQAPATDDVRGGDLFMMLTIASALLLGRLGRALVHAAAAVAPDGRTWLLVGDTHAGKTTTTINLLRTGWRFLSDDHVVLSARPTGELWVEGWPRALHVDEGWDRGEITGRRVAREPGVFGAERWQRSAPLAGLIFPRVDADRPTRAAPLDSVTALTRLIRQTPWFLSDRTAAPDLIRVLQHAAALPSMELSLGRDTYDDPVRLRACLDPALDHAPA